MTPSRAIGCRQHMELPVPVEAHVQHFAVACDGDGLSQVFAVSSANQLVRVSRDADTTNWQTEEIAEQGATPSRSAATR